MPSVNTLSGQAPDLGFEIEFQNKRFLVRTLFTIAVPVVTVIIIIDLLKGRYLVGLCLAIILLVQMFALYYSHKGINARREYSMYINTLTVVNIMVGLICLYTIGIRAEMSRLPWAYLYVVLVISTYQFKSNLIWTSIFLILLLVVIFMEIDSGPLKENGFLFRFIGTYVFLSLSIAIIKEKRYQIQKKFVENHQVLMASESRLRDINALLTEEINSRIQVENALRKSEEALAVELSEKNILIKEIHHRVKNNMQIISSLLRLQIRNETNDRIINAFQEAINRIATLALVHEEIYKSDSLAVIELSDYITSLINGILSCHEMRNMHISLKIEIEKDIRVTPSFAVPCGLTLNELITNALKHAFPADASGEIQISIKRDKNQAIEIRVADTGIGLPQDFDYMKTDTLGLYLVYRLVEGQLHGRIELNREKGTEFIISIQDEPKKDTK